MLPDHIVVEAIVATADNDDDLRECAWAYALDQRAFGPRRLLVAVARCDGRMIGFGVAPRLAVPEVAIGPCVRHVGRGGEVAIAYCDEPIDDGPPPADLAVRFHAARSEAAACGVHLVDWFACDDARFRSTRLSLGARAEDWWDVPRR